MRPVSDPAVQDPHYTNESERLFALAYDELRLLARRHLKGERPDHTLTPTALVHEAYLKIGPQERASFKNRRHFAFIAAQAMRRILVNYARDRNRLKRGGAYDRVTLRPSHSASCDDVELLDLDEALDELNAFDPPKRQLVELRYFGGLTAEETADALGISRATYYREWAAARAWLFGRLHDAS